MKNYLDSLKKIKKQITKNPLVIPALLILLFAVIGTVLPTSRDSKSGNFSSHPTVESSTINFSDPQLYEGLPVGSVEKYEAENAWGTAIYLPQTHKNPGSNSADQSNDSAEIAQNQMYEIISYLHEKTGVNFVMAEGDLYGNVPEEKIKLLSEKIRLRNQLENQITQFEKEKQSSGYASEDADRLVVNVNSYIVRLDREIILTGAPYKVKAEGADITLFGIENEETREQCAEIVRNYIYQKDRASQLSQAGITNGSISSLSGSSKMDSLLSIDSLKSLTGKVKNVTTVDDLHLEIESIKEQTFQEEDLQSLAQAIDQTYHSLQQCQEKESQNTTSTAPSRNDNPYQTVESTQQIQTMMKQSEQQIQDVVIDKRNQETARNFAKGLKEQNADIGILQFGAGHEEGLVKELQKQGITVIVLKPSEVAQRSQSQDVEALKSQVKEKMNQLKKLQQTDNVVPDAEHKSNGDSSSEISQKLKTLKDLKESQPLESKEELLKRLKATK